MSGRLQVRATLGEAFSAYWAHAGVLLPAALVVSLPVVVANALLTDLYFVPIVFAVSVIADACFVGLVAVLLRDGRNGRRDFSVRDLVAEVNPVLLPLIGASLLSWLGITVGMFLLLIPGLILLTIWAVVVPVVAVEHSGAIASLGRSRELVRDNGWEVFGVLLGIGLIAVAAALGSDELRTRIADGTGALIVGGVVVWTLLAPLFALATAAIYFRLAEIKGPPASPGPSAHQSA